MKQLELLIREAQTLTEPELEVERVMKVCNACRYCEGFCAVFPAMTYRLTFGKADVNYLANLCHNCGACLHACQYAPPHEFGVNVPLAMAKVRVETYQEYIWPASFSRLYQRAGMTVALALAFGIGLFLVLVMALSGTLIHPPLAGNFYQIFPHNLLAVMFGSVFVFSICSLLFSTRRFWREISSGGGSLPAVAETTRNVLTLTYLDGGHGEGCNDEDDAFTLRRRRFHHFTFYGFTLCFASTILATGYHFLLGQEAPYELLSLPVILGSLGGIGLSIGSAGLLWLNLRRNPAHGDAAQKPMDRGFILLLLLVSVTGITLLVGRDTSLMASLLAVHLGTVMALFLTLPYGKFAHSFYRTAALLKWAIEKRSKD